MLDDNDDNNNGDGDGNEISETSQYCHVEVRL